MKKGNYYYLDNDEVAVIKEKISLYIKSKKDIILSNVDSITLDFLENEKFDYYEIFESPIVSNYDCNSNNVFYFIDKYCRDNNVYFNTVKLRNSMFDILRECYEDFKKDTNFKTLVDKKTFSVIYDNYMEGDITNLEFFYDFNKKYLNSVVLRKIQKILKAKKYNIV